MSGWPIGDGHSVEDVVDPWMELDWSDAADIGSRNPPITLADLGRGAGRIIEWEPPLGGSFDGVRRLSTEHATPSRDRLG